MITFNEERRIEAAIRSVADWCSEIWVVDSYSTDRTVEICHRLEVNVVQREFAGFGDQWNFAVNELPISATWTMKLDPDERPSELLLASVEKLTSSPDLGYITVRRELIFMGHRLHVCQKIVRAWRTGQCHFEPVLVNEHPIVGGDGAIADGCLWHLDSPDLHHWFAKQNDYSTREATSTYRLGPRAAPATLFGSKLERRMWLKAHLSRLPGRFSMLRLYFFVFTGAFRSGRVGWIWARLRSEIYRNRELKVLEMRWADMAQFDPIGER